MGNVEITYAEAIRDAMSEEMRKDDSVYLMGEDIGVYAGAFGVSRGMLEEFGPERIIDTPISEAAYIGTAVGSAVTGMRPIAELQFSDFVSVCLDQIMNQAAKMHYMFGGKINVPMVIRSASGGGTGAAAQHSQSLENLYAHIPGLKVVMPSTPYDAKGLLKTAIRDNNPVIFLEPKLLYRVKGLVPTEEYLIPFGEADIKRKGEDISIITYGRTVQMSLEVADYFAEIGYEVEVVDIRTLVPLDTDTIIESVKKTHRAVVVHEGVEFGGFGGEIVGLIADKAIMYIDGPIKRVGGMFCPIPFNPYLEAEVLPNVERIKKAVWEALGDLK
ncbi:MAG TPA: alpha-ketoacid dehydrogenase subunit beta [Clostridiaceae bacterium]|nr:alpha-ketoacid dehydrogenase subunit beta [Clostridiaceae bacterium]